MSQSINKLASLFEKLLKCFFNFTGYKLFTWVARQRLTLTDVPLLLPPLLLQGKETLMASR